MRADRLLSILLLLQGRGKMTAKDLADELEVSERTIYRDIDALCITGVPVYSESGHDGGYALVDDYRTNLTGLNREELRALFMLGSLAPLSDLGVRQELRSALLKISVSLPESHGWDDDKIRHSFYFDAAWWQGQESHVPLLQVVQEAIWQGRKLNIVYRTPHAFEVEQSVSPYGLVVKAGRWYLVCARQAAMHVHLVSDLLDVHLTETPFERPASFDLEAFWRHWCSERERFLVHFNARVRAAPNIIPLLSMYFGNWIKHYLAQAGPPDGDGWVTLELPFESFEAARKTILGFGRGMEVLAPRALKLSVLDYAEQIVRLYQAT